MKKIRHVAPFPFLSPAQFTSDGLYLMMLDADLQSVTLWSTETHQPIVKIEKKGDYNIKAAAVHHSNNLVKIAFSDCRDTTIFTFDSVSLQLSKVSTTVCQKNNVG